MDFQEPRPQRRRSERVAKSLPIVVRGIDLLGQPFEERTATFNVNLHGCRYASRYHLPKNAWVTLEVPRGSEFENARARVAWIQRPQTVREFFQISVELETPQNIWRFEPTPQDWTGVEAGSSRPIEAEPAISYPGLPEILESQSANILVEAKEQNVNEVNSAASFSEPPVADSAASAETQTAGELDRGAEQQPAAFGIPSVERAESADIRDQKPWIPEDLFAKWKQEFEVTHQAARDHLAAEMNAAERQWNELLQSSLDTAVHRIAGQLAERAGEIRRPFVESLNEAQETAANLKVAVDQELARGKSSLAEIERSAAQFSTLSDQIGAAKDTALDEFNRRLELILNAQTQEIGERAEQLTSRKVAAAAAELNEASHRTIEAAAAEIESRTAPHYQRAAELLEQLSSREMQAEENLRLHRERLRQVSENSEREFLARLAAVSAAARDEFDAAHKTAAAKWNDEIEASTHVAARAASDSIEKVSEGFEEQWRARLQALADETLESSALALEQRAGETKNKFGSDVDAQSAEHLARIREHLDAFANDLVGRSRTQIEEAAEAAAAGFGRVLRGVSDQEIEALNAKAAAIGEKERSELEASAARLLERFETGAESSVARLHHQMDAQLETSIAEARSALASEFNSSFAGFRSERETHEKEWTEALERLTAESAARYQDRIDTACDSWVVSSVRRLSEHGQNLVESLMRSADQAVRESCAKLFDGLAEILRERSASAMHASHSAGASHASAEAAIPPPEHESGLDRASL